MEKVRAISTTSPVASSFAWLTESASLRQDTPTANTRSPLRPWPAARARSGHAPHCARHEEGFAESGEREDGPDADCPPVGPTQLLQILKPDLVDALRTARPYGFPRRIMSAAGPPCSRLTDGPQVDAAGWNPLGFGRRYFKRPTFVRVRPTDRTAGRSRVIMQDDARVHPRLPERRRCHARAGRGR